MDPQTDSPTPSPPVNGAAIDILWTPAPLIWTVLCGEGVALLLALNPTGEPGSWITFSIASMVIQWTLLSVLASLHLLRRWLRRVRPTRVAQLALVLLLLYAWAITGFALMLADQSVGGAAPWARLTRVGLSALLIGIVALSAFQNHLRATRLVAATKQAQLDALQARVKPHFLFNALNAAASLVRQNPSAAEDVLLDLSDLFRAAMREPGMATLGEELTLARRYLQIEAMRFGDRLQVQWRVDPALDHVPVPSLTLQPLVENAVLHGVQATLEPCTITIACRADGDQACLEVSNTLSGAAASASHLGHKIGLTAVRERLAIVTGRDDALRVDATAQHYRVMITLPVNDGGLPRPMLSPPPDSRAGSPR